MSSRVIPQMQNEVDNVVKRLKGKDASPAADMDEDPDENEEDGEGKLDDFSGLQQGDEVAIPSRASTVW